MWKTLALVFLVLSFLDELTVKGSQLSRQGADHVKSCGDEEHANWDNVNEPQGKMLFENVLEHGKLWTRRNRFLMSLPGKNSHGRSTRASYSYGRSVRDKMKHQQMQLGEGLSEWNQPTTQRPADHISGSGSPQRREDAKNRIEQLRLVNQRRRDRGSPQQGFTTSKQGNPNRRSLAVNKEPPHKASFGIRGTQGPLLSAEHTQSQTEANHKDKSRLKYSNHPDETMHTSNARTSFRSLDPVRVKEPLDLYSNQHRKTEGIFVTESTQINPFIATTQALNYLTSYDSIPLPTRWPIKIILPQSDHKMQQEKTQVLRSSGLQDFLEQNASPYPGSRSTEGPLMQLLQSADNDERYLSQSMGNIVARKDIDQYTNISRESAAVATFENKAVHDHESSRRQIKRKANRQTTGEMQTSNTSGSVRKDAGSEKPKKQKRKKRLRKKLRKRYKKLRKQRRKRKQKMSQVTPTYLAELSNHKTVVGARDVGQIKTEAGPNETTPTNSIRLSSERDTVTTPVNVYTEDSETREKSGGTGVSHQISEHSWTGHRDKIDNSKGGDLQIVPNTTQPPKKVHKKLGRTIILKTNEDSSYKPSNYLVDIAHNENSSDNQMFVSLKPSFGPTPFVVSDNGKKLSKCTEIGALLENCSEENTNGSRDNAESKFINRNSPKHVRGHTNPGLDRKRVTTSPATRWSDPHVIWNNNDQVTENSYRKADQFSTDHETQISHQRTGQNSTIKAIENAKNVDVTNVRKTPNLSDSTATLNMTKMSPLSVHKSEQSSVRQWRERLKQKQLHLQFSSKEHTQTTTQNNVNYNNRRGSLAFAFSKSTTDSINQQTSRTSDSKNGLKEKEDNGPFIGYKSAFDFLSSQKGPKTTGQSENRREANELNRFMAEGMCEIFSKHYVPTRIGGKCE